MVRISAKWVGRRRRVLDQRPVVRGEVLVDGAQGEVAPEDLPPVRAQPRHDRACRGLHPGDGRDPEREAAEKDPEPAQAPDAVTQLAGREAERYGAHGDGYRSPAGTGYRGPAVREAPPSFSRCVRPRCGWSGRRARPAVFRG